MITINGNSIPDPTGYNDNHEQFFADSVSLGVKRQRNRRGKLKYAEMFWDYLEPSEFQQLIALFENGDEVAFSNDASSYGLFAFNGIPDLPLDAGDYVGGGTYLRSLKVVLREV